MGGNDLLDVKKLRVEYLENPVGIGERKPRFSWIVESDQKNVLQTSYQIQVLEKGAGFHSPLWDSGSVASDSSIHISYAGKALRSRTRYDYRVRITDNHGNESPWSEISYFETGILDPKEWCADFITPVMEDTSNSSKCPYLRREFAVTKKISTARIYATSLGLYELHINGQAIDEVLFTPGWTSYHHRLQYQTYDVTEKLNTGLNTVGAILGSGWYNGDLTWNRARNFYGENLAHFVQLHICFEDGSEQVITSDESWKTDYGPILFSEIYHGEIYDAREDIPGWDLPGYDDTSWKEIKRLDIDKTILTAQDGVFVKRIKIVKPIGIIKTPESETVIDMGQNMVGRIRFQVEGPRGSKVVLKHAEVLDKAGNFYTENLRSAKQTVEYILKGSGVETFEPHFTFQGFRYVKLEEYPGEPVLESFTGIVIHSDMKKTGNFTCSNDLLNQLQHNILWGQKGNFLDVPTDCPQRDERLGWTGDAQVFIRTACFNMDVAAFFRKWLRDLKTDQYEGGGLPHVIPDVLYNRNGSSSGWGDAAVICPWTLYLCYGDVRILEEQYESMKSWVEYIRSKAENGLLWNSGSHFGDWLGLDAKEGSYKGATTEDLISTAFYAYSTELLAKTAKLLGNMEDSAYYSQLHESIKKAYQDEFITP
jgi:alpha-L-rhamnosidase